MKIPDSFKSLPLQYATSLFAVITVASICFPLADWIGYRTVSLVLLLTLSVLAMLFRIGPVSVAAVLSALIWDFFFIPPHFTLSVANTEDALMLLMYFIIALLNGILTHQMKLYERIVRKREDKEKTLHLYNTLFNSLSHELRTPIATIMAASDNLLSEEETWSEEDRKAMTEEINVAAGRLNRLVDNLLNVSRLESGQMVLRWSWCDLNELIGTAIQRLRPELQNRRIEIQIPESMPLVRLDFVLMEQAIFNLLHNAVTYTPEPARILVQAEYLEGQTLRISISDNGPGFHPQDLHRIFDKFYRPAGSKAGGVGLGLSIVWGVINAHHGHINAQNGAEGGAQFVMEIPTGHLYHTQQAS